MRIEYMPYIYDIHINTTRGRHIKKGQKRYAFYVFVELLSTPQKYTM